MQERMENALFKEVTFGGLNVRLSKKQKVQKSLNLE